MVSLSCGHCYCYECQFRPPLLKIQCRQCRERTGLVIENQLRLVVQCYKHMCYILADYLRKTGKEETDGIGKDSSEFDPIAEILAEVQKGVKVSRAVLVVRPPAKYLKPVTSVTPRKDHSRPTASSSPSGSTQTPTGDSTTQQTTPGDMAVKPRRTPVGSEGKVKLKKKKISVAAVSKQPRGKGESSDGMTQGYESAGTTSEEEIDVLSVTNPGNKLPRVKVNDVDVQDLEVNTICLDEDYISVTDSTVSVKDNDQQTLNDSISSAVISPYTQLDKFRMNIDRSFSPLSPRVVMKRRKTEGTHSTAVQPQDKQSKPEKRKRKEISSSIPSEDESAIEVIATPEASKLEVLESPLPPKKRKRSPQERPRCRCGTNHPQTVERICARNKCPCYLKAIPCVGCLCKQCHNPHALK